MLACDSVVIVFPSGANGPDELQHWDGWLRRTLALEVFGCPILFALCWRKGGVRRR